MRLGCSLSTVKRHLRRARRGQSPAVKAPRPRPEVSAVLDAFDTVIDHQHSQPRRRQYPRRLIRYSARQRTIGHQRPEPL